MAYILIIDDEDQVRAMMRQMLERAGHHVFDAPNGKAAIAICRTEKIDLIITDLLMPEKDGIETIVELRRDYPGIRIIAVSGGGSTGRLDLLPAAQQLGAITTFRKPFSRPELIASIESILAQPLPQS